MDYSELHDYNVNLSRINKSLNQIAKRASATGNIYQQDMDAAIRKVDSYEDFISRMRAKGYSVKGEDFGEKGEYLFRRSRRQSVC